MKKDKLNFDQNNAYSIEEAVKLVKDNAKAKFDESVEVHIRIGIDPKKGEQQVRATVVLPHGTGKSKRVAVFTENETEAKEAGADIFGGKELINKIKAGGSLDFDVAVATPEMMKEIASIAKILGPRGLMPSPKNETVVKDIKKAAKQLKGGKINFKNDETSNIHQIIGKVSWDINKLKENYQTFVDAVKKAKPSGVKGVYIKQIVLCSTMGPSVKASV